MYNKFHWLKYYFDNNIFILLLKQIQCIEVLSGPDLSGVCILYTVAQRALII